MKLFQLPQQLWLQQPYAGKSGHSQLPPPTHLPYSIPSLRLKIRTFTLLALSDPGASGELYTFHSFSLLSVIVAYQVLDIGSFEADSNILYT